jgi:hypothetical protein
MPYLFSKKRHAAIKAFLGGNTWRVKLPDAMFIKTFGLNYSPL